MLRPDHAGGNRGDRRLRPGARNSWRGIPDNPPLARQSDGQGVTTASRWPIGKVEEGDLHLTTRSNDFACTGLVTKILTPQPIGWIWLVNHSRTGSSTTKPNGASKQRRRREASTTSSPKNRDTLSSQVTSTPNQMPTASGSGPENTSWTTSASATATHGQAFTPPSRAHVRSSQPHQRRLGLAVPSHRPHSGALQARTVAPPCPSRTVSEILDRPHNAASAHYGLIAELTTSPTTLSMEDNDAERTIESG